MEAAGTRRGRRTWAGLAGVRGGSPRRPERGEHGAEVREPVIGFTGQGADQNRTERVGHRRSVRPQRDRFLEQNPPQHLLRRLGTSRKPFVRSRVGKWSPPPRTGRPLRALRKSVTCFGRHERRGPARGVQDRQPAHARLLVRRANPKSDTFTTSDPSAPTTSKFDGFTSRWT